MMKETVERRDDLINRLRNDGRIRVSEMVSHYGVSSVTIRNDLAYLEKQGIIYRTRGGAILKKQLVVEQPVNVKQQANYSSKQAIGKVAATLVRDDSNIILDSGTTTFELARQLVDRRLLVMTNGLNVARALSSADEIEVRVTGGTLRKRAESFYGPHAEDSLKNMHFDQFFLGVDGFDLNTGITTYNEMEARLNRRMCEVSQEIIAVTDSSKFDRRSVHAICNITDISRLVTDPGIPDRYRELLEQNHIEVIIACEGSQKA
ncbi:transcriptional repressor AgaR [Endozoicomonas lisbonensis]|uniref:DeoR family transcriptional regulator of aga operon n=1 Tax=Endozoicomonas lisbonensis TaxID=3120522 RepID=A0ABV2SAR9_9GAMM